MLFGNLKVVGVCTDTDLILTAACERIRSYNSYYVDLNLVKT